MATGLSIEQTRTRTTTTKEEEEAEEETSKDNDKTTTVVSLVEDIERLSTMMTMAVLISLMKIP